jgi:hypothetical protein
MYQGCGQFSRAGPIAHSRTTRQRCANHCPLDPIRTEARPSVGQLPARPGLEALRAGVQAVRARLEAVRAGLEAGRAVVQLVQLNVLLVAEL